MRLPTRPYFPTPAVKAAYCKRSPANRKRILALAKTRALANISEFDVDSWTFAVLMDDINQWQAGNPSWNCWKSGTPRRKTDDGKIQVVRLD